MASTQQSLEKIRQYAAQTAHAFSDSTESEQHVALTEARIDRTLEQLQTRVREQEAALTEVSLGASWVRLMQELNLSTASKLGDAYISNPGTFE
jgi:chromosomal replication initiation ATPase DnaA